MNQDSVGELVPTAGGGVIPSIDTTKLTTQVLVGNGETVVLGGVFKNEETTQIQKVPFLGDMPKVKNNLERPFFTAYQNIREKKRHLSGRH